MFTLFCGPCVIESREHTLYMCEQLQQITNRLDIPFVFKASFDKANRTSIHSYRGPGLEEGLDILRQVRQAFHVPVITDIHEPWQAAPVAEVADYIQIPAFLCRQTDLLLAAGMTGKTINIKKGQFLSGAKMREAVDKVYSTGNRNVMLCERGTMFGYQQLVVDMTNIIEMKKLGVPVVFDATHSVQTSSASSHTSCGSPEYIPHLAKAAITCGADHIFMEVHDAPQQALSDGTNMLPLDQLEPLLRQLKALWTVVREAECSL